MKRILLTLVCLAFSLPVLAQNADDPASADDVTQLLQTMRSHDMIQRTMEAMQKPMQQMYHDQFAKQRDKLPADFESRMNKMMGDMLKDMPFDQMMQAMIPAYQRHFTHGDITALNAFYSSPVGQKFLQETPAVTGEAMQAMVPILTKYSAQWQQRMQKEIEEMQDGAPKKPTVPSSLQN